MSEQTQTPTSQLADKSAEERRLQILMISGMFHNGKPTDATNPIFSTNDKLSILDAKKLN